MTRRTPWPHPAVAAVLDVLVVVVFTLIGRRTHDEPLDPAGWWETAWPFLAALALGWALAALVGRSWPTRVLPGVVVWLVTVAGGMFLRSLGDQGTALPFVIVATLFLGATLLGWRAVAQFLAGRRSG